jgi:hypothetical protein
MKTAARKGGPLSLRRSPNDPGLDVSIFMKAYVN